MNWQICSEKMGLDSDESAGLLLRGMWYAGTYGKRGIPNKVPYGTYRRYLLCRCIEILSSFLLR